MPKATSTPTWEIYSHSRGEHLFVLFHSRENAAQWINYWVARGFEEEDLEIRPTQNMVACEVYDPETGTCTHHHSKPTAQWHLDHKVLAEIRGRCIIRPITGCGG